VRIFGPLEARLQSFQRVVLGGLNEGTWPPETRSDPWLSRPMRRDLGLDPPERRIGLSAHDFAQALGAEEVILARAAKVAGAPTVASRFVQRIAALAGPRWGDVLERGNHSLDYARALDQPALVKAAARPAPRPKLEARPLRLSVTAIETGCAIPTPSMPLHSAPAAARRRHVAGRAPRHRHPRRIGDFPELPPAARRSGAERARRTASPRSPIIRRRAFWWLRFGASPLVRTGTAGGAI
jgi:ATP-dependent helicase/nuclease subunit B